MTSTKNKLPIVAIIGQTNAGKSSLFNRMARGRLAIVAHEEGTTRDNVTARVQTESGQGFLLVDTAGLKDPSDEFEATIQDQIADAIEMADVILLTVDSTRYTNQDDKGIARRALKSGKPLVLVLNKADLRESLPEHEFLSLGVKQMIKVSAEHGQGVTELLEEITAKLPPYSNDSTPTEKSQELKLKIALVGRPNVGKSSLFNALAGKQQAIVANLSGTTRDVNTVNVRFNQRDLKILDTAGVRRPGKQEVGIEKFSVLRTMNAIEQSDICLLLIDATEPHSAFDQRLAGTIKEAGKGIILVVTKWDLYTGDSDELLTRLKNDFNFIPFAPVILTSSLTGRNVAKIFEQAEKIDSERKKEIKTNELNRVLREVVAAHPPAGLKNTMPKLKYIVQTDVAPPWFVVYGHNLALLHWSYKRYLERAIRENFGFDGTPIMFSFKNSDGGNR